MKLTKIKAHDWYSGWEVYYKYEDYLIINIGSSKAIWCLQKNHNTIQTFKTLREAKLYLKNHLNHNPNNI
mgnify:CR=1 FL=1|tara:strand:- start:1933 stop:2142 length:210 start_codon:yes stop_codon:yes gene_type:complete